MLRIRGQYLGAEFRGKGVNVALGPMMNMGCVFVTAHVIAVLLIIVIHPVVLLKAEETGRASAQIPS